MKNILESLHEPMHFGYFPSSNEFTHTLYRRAKPEQVSLAAIIEQAGKDEVIIHGRIVDKYGLPVKNARIEMWHSNQWGVYGFEFGPDPAPINPIEQAWKFTMTNDDGSYLFRASQPVKNNSYTPHFQFKVTTRNEGINLFELYIAKSESEELDSYLQEMTPEERAHCMAESTTITSKGAKFYARDFIV